MFNGGVTLAFGLSPFGEHMPCIFYVYFKLLLKKCILLNWNVGVSLNFTIEFNKTQYA